MNGKGEKDMRIVIKDILNGRNYPDAGVCLYDIMMNNIDSTDKFVWDLSGVSELPSMFLNVSMGRLIKEKGESFVKSHISFANITKSQIDRIIKYVEIMSQPK